MTSKKPLSSSTEQPRASNAAEVNSEPALNDLEVKSFFLLVGVIMAIIPSLIVGAFGVWIPFTFLILSNLSITVLHHLSDSKLTQPYIDDWKQGLRKVDVAVFELGMGLSRLAVLLCWMLKDACISILVFCLALLLTALVLVWEGGSERYSRGSAAFGEFYAQLKGWNNAAEAFEYLAS